MAAMVVVVVRLAPVIIVVQILDPVLEEVFPILGPIQLTLGAFKIALKIGKLFALPALNAAFFKIFDSIFDILDFIFEIIDFIIDPIEPVQQHMFQEVILSRPRAVIAMMRSLATSLGINPRHACLLVV